MAVTPRRIQSESVATGTIPAATHRSAVAESLAGHRTAGVTGSRPGVARRFSAVPGSADSARGSALATGVATAPAREPGMPETVVSEPLRPVVRSDDAAVATHRPVPLRESRGPGLESSARLDVRLAEFVPGRPAAAEPPREASAAVVPQVAVAPQRAPLPSVVAGPLPSARRAAPVVPSAVPVRESLAQAAATVPTAVAVPPPNRGGLRPAAVAAPAVRETAAPQGAPLPGVVAGPLPSARRAASVVPLAAPVRESLTQAAAPSPTAATVPPPNHDRLPPAAAAVPASREAAAPQGAPLPGVVAGPLPSARRAASVVPLAAPVRESLTQAAAPSPTAATVPPPNHGSLHAAAAVPASREAAAPQGAPLPGVVAGPLPSARRAASVVPLAAPVRENLTQAAAPSP
ncbi:MAG: hypothetical protein A3K18_31425, partial [Lentisphaerae bacterium RIFOXYA12_64_32]